MPRQTAAEKQVLEETAAQLAAGADPFGDNEDIVKPGIEEQAAAAAAELARANGDPDPAAIAADNADDDADPEQKPAAEASTDEDPEKDKPPAAAEPSEEEKAAAAAAAAAPGDDAGEDEGQSDDEDFALEPRGWTGKPIAELTAREAAIDTELAAKFKEYSDGTLDADEYTKSIGPLQVEQRKLTATLARAEAAQEQADRYQQTVIQQVAKDAAKDGIRYIANEKDDDATKAAARKAANQYDTALRMLLQDPDNARRSYKSLAREADAAVRALRGIGKAQTAAAAPAPAAAREGKPPARAQAGTPPTTMRQIPAAATANASGASPLEEQGRALKGQAYQAWYGKLTDAQKAKVRGDTD